MADQSLYRRHRPQSFAEVVGQEHVVRTLSNAIERDRVHHAYLFVGSRGTGKTSMAKILARSLNCVEGPTLTPCGKCESCLSIASGSSMDVIEMDAASNRSVDDIRDLRERVGYAAAAGRWKVYILDEAHMLTREAWNAFLKTLEEPPPATVFVLATTEAHKVMPTIVDRCQRFDFSRPSPDEIAVVIERAASAEGIELAEGVVGAVARAANGSFRDALGTLDQLVAYSGERVSLEDALNVLGVADADLLFAAADAIGAGDGKRALEVSAKLSRAGHDPGRFAADLISHLRQLLVIATLGSIPDHFLIVSEQRDRMATQAERLGEVAMLRAIDELSAAVAAIREGDEPRMTVELALLRSARPDVDPSRAAMVQRIEALERALAGAGPTPTPPTPPKAPIERSPAETPTPTPVQSQSDPEPADPTPPAEGHESPAGAGPSAAATAVEPPRPGGGGSIDSLEAAWPSVVDHMRQSGAGMLAAIVSEARPIGVDASGRLTLGFPPEAAFNQRQANDKDNREKVAEALRAVVGEALHPEFLLLDGEETTEPDPPEEKKLSENEIVERFIAEFDAEVLDDDQEEGAAAEPVDARPAAEPNEEAS